MKPQQNHLMTTTTNLNDKSIKQLILLEQNTSLRSSGWLRTRIFRNLGTFGFVTACKYGAGISGTV